MGLWEKNACCAQCYHYDTSMEARLAKLESLKEKGLISEEEYAIKRKKMIDEI